MRHLSRQKSMQINACWKLHYYPIILWTHGQRQRAKHSNSEIYTWCSHIYRTQYAVSASLFSHKQTEQNILTVYLSWCPACELYIVPHTWNNISSSCLTCIACIRHVLFPLGASDQMARAHWERFHSRLWTSTARHELFMLPNNRVLRCFSSISSYSSSVSSRIWKIHLRNFQWEAVMRWPFFAKGLAASSNSNAVPAVQLLADEVEPCDNVMHHVDAANLEVLPLIVWDEIHPATNHPLHGVVSQCRWQSLCDKMGS